MHAHLKSALVSQAGCDPNASDDAAQKFYEGLGEEKRKVVDDHVAKLEDGDSGDDSAAMKAIDATNKNVAALAASVTKLAASIKPPEKKSDVDPSKKPEGEDDDSIAVALEEKRVGNVKKLCALHGVDDGQTAVFLSQGGKLEDVRKAILKHVADNAKPLASLKVGDDQRVAALTEAMPQAMLLRAGVEPKLFEKNGVKIHELAGQLRQQRVLDMARQFVISLGAAPGEVYGLSPTMLASSLGPRSMRARFPKLALAESTSDFSSITLDAINKVLRFNYLDAKRTWPIWAEKKFVSDFKQFNSIAMSEAPSMKSRDEGGEVKYVTLSDSKETGRLVEYVAGIKLTRRALINDDLDAFNTIPRLQANSAARLEDDTAYALITANGTMADTGALFNATAVTTAGGHANYTSSGGVPSVANLQTGKTLMKKQKGLAGAARLELEPAFLLVPTSIEETTKELIGSEKLIAQYTAGSTNPVTVGDNNPFFNRYQVIGSTRLDDNSATAWYMLADYREGQVSTFQLWFLTDEPEPVLRSESDFDTEDVKYLVRHSVAGLVPEFRGAYKNAGA